MLGYRSGLDVFDVAPRDLVDARVMLLQPLYEFVAARVDDRIDRFDLARQVFAQRVGVLTDALDHGLAIDADELVEPATDSRQNASSVRRAPSTPRRLAR